MSTRRNTFSPAKLAISAHHPDNKDNHLYATQDGEPLPYIRLDESVGHGLTAVLSANNDAGIGEWCAETCHEYLRMHAYMLKSAHGIHYSPQLLKDLVTNTHAALNRSSKSILHKRSNGAWKLNVEYTLIHQLSAGEQHVDVAIVHSNHHPVFLLRPRVKKGLCDFLKSDNSPLGARKLDTKTVHSFRLRRGDRLALGSQELSYVSAEIIREIYAEVGTTQRLDTALMAYKHDKTTMPEQTPVNPSICLLVMWIP